MPMFATYDNMRRWGADVAANARLREATKREGKTTFLSHSSKDDDLVPGAVVILENHGGNVYVDHMDPENAKEPNTVVADHLRNVIRGCRRFVLLATPRSKDSRWIPWELGLADALYTPDK